MQLRSCEPSLWAGWWSFTHILLFTAEKALENMILASLMSLEDFTLWLTPPTSRPYLFSRTRKKCLSS
ncbi:rCG36503 [Rattus norvegicus]|uniref:RCG36503 n=1 Tax=Rattus norvegicus TaxID=10116 RepID=A6JS75_RAT|nr:rCG36503 [Rattus norvegicus]